ncbi:MAG TPA: zinc dependent phospholipase C family protein [Bacteroidia bacterium]|nr:zinc dependent phospholipase C family protein [Bacteroidia bacterium]
MKTKNHVLVLLLLLGVFSTHQLYSWGFFAHKRINRMAVFTLPPEMFSFYKKHIEYITDHATDPDSRRNVVADEAPRHYIDCDHYSTHPFDSIPTYWKAAVAKYSEDSLKAYGIVPWHIEVMMYRLTDAFKQGNIDRILKLSSEIGHYIGDSHVPLHTTENYNGQLTGQRGIHGFWESRIPELKAEGYDYFVGRAEYIENPLKKAWETVQVSFSEKDSVLLFEAELSKKILSDKKYSFENRGTTTVKVYSEEYTSAYDKMLNGMVERRMMASILTVGSMWYTAWVNAGQPNLDRLDTKEVSDSLRKANEAEEYLWKHGKPLETVKGHTD